MNFGMLEIIIFFFSQELESLFYYTWDIIINIGYLIEFLVPDVFSLEHTK
jgi:hypothetical protein